MEVRTDSKNGAPVASSADTVKVFQVETQARKDQWAEQLQDNPDDFADIEQQIDQHYRRGAGQLIASLLVEVTNNPPMDEHAEKIRRNSAIPLRVPEPRTLKIRLLCGLMLWITTSYRAPRRGKNTETTEQLAGLYPELAALGMGKDGKKKKGTRPKFDTPWREPKALIIFEFNEQGKMIKKERQPLIDGTLLGPDHLAELVAFHLHRLGVAQAELVVFISDGAPWIWNRLEWIERRAGLDSSKTIRVLDFCHAAHHISLALAALGLSGDARRKTYGYLRQLLKKGRYDEVVSELKERAKRMKLKEDHDVWTEIRYLENHGSKGHLRYATFRRRGIPCGSGAIESTIRRVINLRLKSNAMYWLEENAEGMFAVRALLLCHRWEETLYRVRQAMARDRRTNWQWRAPDLTDLKANESASPPSAKTREKQHQPAIAL